MGSQGVNKASQERMSQGGPSPLSEAIVDLPSSLLPLPLATLCGESNKAMAETWFSVPLHVDFLLHVQ